LPNDIHEDKKSELYEDEVNFEELPNDTTNDDHNESYEDYEDGYTYEYYEEDQAEVGFEESPNDSTNNDNSSEPDFDEEEIEVDESKAQSSTDEQLIDDADSPISPIHKEMLEVQKLRAEYERAQEETMDMMNELQSIYEDFIAQQEAEENLSQEANEYSSPKRTLDNLNRTLSLSSIDDIPTDELDEIFQETIDEQSSLNTTHPIEIYQDLNEIQGSVVPVEWGWE